MTEIDAVGDIAQGGLTARALEPAHGENDGHTTEHACLNCGAPLDGPFCRACGQRGHVHRTLGAFFHDLLHGVLHFEGKIWRTLPLLVWQPGKLTREYIDGRRASYISPIALFLFAVFLTFAGFNAMGSGIDLGATITVNGENIPIAEAERQFADQLEALEESRQQALAAGRPVAHIDDDLRGLRRTIATVEAVRNDDLGALARNLDPTDGEASDAGGFSPAALLQRLRDNADLLLYELQSSAYKYSWLLIPISVPFVWLMFPFSRRFHLYDHTVFVTYSLSFMMFALLLVAAGTRWDIVPLVVLALLYAPFHIYRQVRGTYATSVLGALWRTGALLVAAAIALALWGLAILVLILGA